MNMSGLRVDAPKFSTETKARIITVIDFIRDAITLPDEAEKGTRFKSNDHVIWLIESGATEAEVNEQLNEAVRLGLIEAARSDWWYNHEKDWGDDYDYAEEVEDEEATSADYE